MPDKRRCVDPMAEVDRVIPELPSRFTTSNVWNMIYNTSDRDDLPLTVGQVRYAVARHPRIAPVSRDRYGTLYSTFPPIPEGHAVISVYPCGCLNGADSQPTARSITEAQGGDCRAEIVPMAEAKRRMDESWGHRDDCPERRR